MEKIEELDPAFVRISISGGFAANFSKDPSLVDWKRIDRVLEHNSNRKILLTLAPQYEDDTGEVRIVPQNDEEIESFLAFVEKLVDLYGTRIAYWQLGNEITTAKIWPESVGSPDEPPYPFYVKLFNGFHDRIKARLPESKIVFAGIARGNQQWQNAKAIIEVIGSKLDAIDLHHHVACDGEARLVQRIRKAKRFIASLSVDHPIELLVTENSTWTDIPDRLSYQSEADHAAYGVRSVYSALVAGVRYCSFGVPQDRIAWQGVEQHRFSLNGLYYNEDKTSYVQENPESGDMRKLAVPAFRLMTRLLQCSKQRIFASSPWEEGVLLPQLGRIMPSYPWLREANCSTVNGQPRQS